MDIQIVGAIFFIAIVLFIFFTSVLFKYFGTGIIENKEISIVTVINSSDNITDRLSMIADDLAAECIASGINVIIVDGGMSIHQKEICDIYCEKYSFLIYTTPDMLCNVIFELKNRKPE